MLRHAGLPCWPAGALVLIAGVVGLGAAWLWKVADAEGPATISAGGRCAGPCAVCRCSGLPGTEMAHIGGRCSRCRPRRPRDRRTDGCRGGEPCRDDDVRERHRVAGPDLVATGALDRSGARRSLTSVALAAGTGGSTVALALASLGESTTAPLAGFGLVLLAATQSSDGSGRLRRTRKKRWSTCEVWSGTRPSSSSPPPVFHRLLRRCVLDHDRGRGSGGAPAPGVQAIVALVGAAALRPGAVVLRGIIDRMLFGDRPDSLRAATWALDRFGADPATALEAVRESLVLPYAHLVVGARVIATSGVRVTSLHTIPLSLADGTEGGLVIGLRPGDLRLAPGDEQVLRLVGPLLAQSVRARVLAAELQRLAGPRRRHHRGGTPAPTAGPARRLGSDLDRHRLLRGRRPQLIACGPGHRREASRGPAVGRDRSSEMRCAAWFTA